MQCSDGEQTCKSTSCIGITPSECSLSKGVVIMDLLVDRCCFSFSIDLLWFPARRCDISGTLVVSLVVFVVQNFLVWKLSKLSKAVEQIHTTKVFTYGDLRAEHRATGDHSLSHYSQGLQRNFVKECLYGDRKLQLCSTKNECYDKWSRYNYHYH